jgi:hypothetical protein
MSYPPPPSPAYPPGPGAPPPGKVRLRGRIPRILGWTLLGLAVALFIAGVVVVGTKSYSKVNGFQRVPVPTNNSTVRFDHPGKYVAYYEASDVDSGIREVPAVGVAIQAPDGTVTRITHGYKEHSDGKIDIFTYNYNGHKGVGLYEFNITQTGVYHVATRPTPSTASDAQIAFGKDISGGAVAGGVLVIIGIVFGIAAIVLLIIGYVKRSNHKGELQRGQQYWGGVPTPAYGGQPSGGYGAPQGFAPPPPGFQPPPQQGPPQQGPPQQGPPQQGPPGYGQQPPPPYGAPPPASDEAPEQPSFGDPTAPSRDDSAER